MRRLALLTMSSILLGALAAAPASAAVPATPTVEGPITGPGPMHPAIRLGPDGTNPDDFDYVAEEYFVSGFAAGAPYKVRVVVRRPSKPNKFSGIVVYEPTHRGGNALIFQFARYGILQRGHAGVTVSARQINLVNPATPSAGLQVFNPARYGSLHVTDNQSNEILAQIAWLIKSNNLHSPLGPKFHVKGIVMGGTSDSSAATRSYMGTVHNALFRTPDNGPIIDGFFVSSTLGSAPVEMTDVPTIQLPTQFEVNGTVGYRRPDSDTPSNRFRIYEVAGMSHNDSRDQPADVFPGCGEPLSRFPHGAMNFMGLQHVIDWAFHGKTPPHAAYMEVNPLPLPQTIVFDRFGNAEGGVRTPHMDVPVYHYIVPNVGPGLCNQSGRQEILSDKILQQLYKSFGQYASKFDHSLDKLEREGFWPSEYTKRYGLDDVRDIKPVLKPILNAGAHGHDARADDEGEHEQRERQQSEQGH